MRIFRIVLIFFCLNILAWGDSFKLEGIIASVDNVKKTITVDSIYGDTIVVQILPNTEIELDDCGMFGMSKYGTFKNLLPGTFVEIKLYFPALNNGGERANPIAYEIEIECYKKRAY